MVSAVKIISVILASAVIFGAGMVTGNYVTRKKQENPPRDHTPQRGPHGWSKRFLEFKKILEQELRDELALTPAQLQQIDALFKRSQEEMNREFRPLFDKRVEELKAEFLNVLTPEQRAKLKELTQRVWPKPEEAKTNSSTNTLPVE